MIQSSVLQNKHHSMTLNIKNIIKLFVTPFKQDYIQLHPQVLTLAIVSLHQKDKSTSQPKSIS